MRDSPYKFLDYYDDSEEDARLFFGRERETQLLLSDIVVNRLVVLFAETGTGKTSLINAGVRPRLKARGYSTFFIRVGRDPTESARAEISSLPGFPGLRGEGLAKQLRHAAEDLGQPIVLFFDQFEEFFQNVFREDRKRAEAFIADVARLHEDEDSGVHIVFSLREDWFVEMDHFRDEIPTIFHKESSLRLRWFDGAQARAAMTRPLEPYGASLAADLVDRIVKDLSNEDGEIEPAQLQIICHTLWKERRGPEITTADYERLGGSGGGGNVAKRILDRHIEALFDQIDSLEQLALLERLLPLLRTDRGTKYGRDFESLVSMLGTTTDGLEPLLGQLERSGFLRRTRRLNSVVIELTHDYLAHRVPDLQDRVRAIALRRKIRAGMARVAEWRSRLDQARTDGSAAPASPSENPYPSDAELEEMGRGFGLLGGVGYAELAFLLEAALEHGIDMEDWFRRAVDGGVRAWEILETKVTDEREPIGQAENAVRLLGEIGSGEALTLLETALGKVPLAPRAVDAICGLKSPERFRLLREALGRSDLAGQVVVGKLDQIRTRESVELLGSLLDGDLASDASRALDRIAKSRVSPAAGLAEGLLARRRSSRAEEGTGEPHQPADPGMAPAKTITRPADIDGMRENDWGLLLRRIRDGRCTPLLGAGLTADAPSLRSTIASRLASQVKYRLDDASDLSRVAQFAAINYDWYVPREFVAESLESLLDRDDHDPSGPHATLARLPLAIYLTNDYDPLLVNALGRAGRDPIRERYAWNPTLRGEQSRMGPDFQPTVARPLVYHLYGIAEEPSSLVLTQDDLLDLWAGILEEPQAFHPVIRRALMMGSLLFVGHDIESLDFRLLIRALDPYMKRNERGGIVQVPPLASTRASDEQWIEYTTRYLEARRLRVYWGTAREFLAELRERWETYHDAT